MTRLCRTALADKRRLRPAGVGGGGRGSQPVIAAAVTWLLAPARPQRLVITMMAYWRACVIEILYWIESKFRQGGSLPSSSVETAHECRHQVCLTDYYLYFAWRSHCQKIEVLQCCHPHLPLLTRHGTMFCNIFHNKFAKHKQIFFIRHFCLQQNLHLTS